jgi:hypothetical protein
MDAENTDKHRLTQRFLFFYLRFPRKSALVRVLFGFCTVANNRGNNRQAVFFERDNYLYFLKGLKKYIVPNVDILVYSLMPTHYHLLGRVKGDKTSEVFLLIALIKRLCYNMDITSGINETQTTPPAWPHIRTDLESLPSGEGDCGAVDVRKPRRAKENLRGNVR